MNFLLLIISQIFAGVIFIFHILNEKRISEISIRWEYSWFLSLTGEIFYDSLLFCVFGVFLFFMFTHFWFSKKNTNNNNEIETESDILNENIRKNITIFNKEKISDIFFKKYIYYFWFILFYIAIYFILQWLGVANIRSIILFFNVIIGGTLFIWTSKIQLFRDFTKINTIIFSLFYICFYLYNFLWEWVNIYILDIINTVCIFIFFGITFYVDSIFLQKERWDTALIIYFFIYSYTIMSFYWKMILSQVFIDINQIVFYISMIFNVWIYYFLQKIPFLESYKFLLRGLSFLFLYCATIIGVYILIEYFPVIWNDLYFIIALLFYSFIFNFNTHTKYQNYISLIFSLITGVFLLFYIFINYYMIEWGKIPIKGPLVLWFTLSFFIIFYTYYFEQKNKIDYYILHFFSYIISWVSIIYYFTISDWEKLEFGTILLLFSFLMFFSFFRLKKIKKQE